jgi:predicted RNA binding protein YcfA (HicA-like mRNA interferase family)
MTVELKSTRKVAVVGWDTEVVKGSHASMQVEGEEKRNVDNDGESNLFFPLEFSGHVDVTIAGSHSGEETGTITIA